VLRDDVRPGLRITNFRRRVAIAFYVVGDRLTILGIFNGGQNYEAILLDEENE
jgi:toxin ParE1/3/4